MGQKVNPIGIRLGISKGWTANWYADKARYGDYLIADMRVRTFLNKACKAASVSSILIERQATNVRITIYSARPGAIIGKKGDEIEQLRKKASAIVQLPVQLSIKEVKKPDLDAQLVAQGIAQQLERRAAFRRVMKRTLQTVMRAGAQGVRVRLGGRLGGAEIARAEWAHEGRVPLHTFRANMSYSTAEALTTYGIIGVKVWIYKGEVHGVAQEDN